MAEPTPNPTPAPESTPTPPTKTEPTPKPPAKLTEDAIEAAVAAAKAEWDKDNAKKLEEAKAEGARLARLSTEQRKAEEDKLKAEAFAKEKAEFEREKLIMYAETELTKVKLSTDIAKYIAIENKENTKAIVDALKKTVDDGIQAGVAERLKGKTPPLGGGQPTEPGGFMDIIRENQR